MRAIFDDIRYSLRMLRRTKGLTFVATASLAIGIGANAAVFSLVDAFLLRPRAVSQPRELVTLYTGHRGSPFETASYPSYLHFRERNDVFTGLAAYGVGWQFKLSGADDVERVWGEAVSGNYFDVLGVRAHIGRTFVPEEDQVPNRNPVVVIAHSLWQRRFASDPGLIGNTINLNGQQLTVVGVAPPEYTGMTSGWASEIWVPAMVTPLLEPSLGEIRLTSRGSRWVTMVGRLRPGTTLEQARTRFELLADELRLAHPGEWLGDASSPRELFVTLLPENEARIHPALRAPVYALAALLFVTVNLVLATACINLVSMYFARAVARRGEIAIRLALGASRATIVRQLLTESVLVSTAAGLIGVLLALRGLDALLTFMPALPEGIQVAIDVGPDWRVFAFTLAFATATGLLFGLAPALRSSRTAVSTILKNDATVATTFRRSWARTTLVVAQIALSLLVLIAAGLLLRSLDNVRPARLGFTSDNIVVAPVELDEQSYDRAASQRFYQRLSEEVAAVPGVRAVSLVDQMPGGFMGRTRRSTEIEGYSPQPGESLEIDAAFAGPRYFTNMQFPFVAGRDFDARDREGSPCVAIINEAFARRYFSNVSAALGKQLVKFEGSRDSRVACAIVGIIQDDAWQTLNGEIRPFYALAAQQADRRRMILLVETMADPANLTPAVRQTIRTLDANLPLADVQTLNEHFGTLIYPFRLLGFIMTACGITTLLLATIGIYGTVAFSIAQRRREVGIRFALGAMRNDILRMVVGQGMTLVGYGLAAGLLASLALMRVLTSLPLDMQLLFGVSATDSFTFAGVTLALALVALAACYVPARRASMIDPAASFRDN